MEGEAAGAPRALHRRELQDGDAPSRPGSDQDRRLERRQACRAAMSDSHGNRRLCRRRPARHPEGRLSLFWAVSHSARENRCVHRLYQHGSGRRVPRLWHVASDLGVRIPDGHHGGKTRARSARVSAQELAQKRRALHSRRHAGGLRSRGRIAARGEGNRLGEKKRQAQPR